MYNVPQMQRPNTIRRWLKLALLALLLATALGAYLLLFPGDACGCQP